MEELVKKEDSKRTPSKKTLNRIFSRLETALNQALESVKTLQPLSAAGEENAKLSIEAIITQAPEISKDEVEHILSAAKKGDIAKLIVTAEELQTRSDAYTPLSEKLIQLAENLDFEVIEELVSGPAWSTSTKLGASPRLEYCIGPCMQKPVYVCAMIYVVLYSHSTA